MGNAFVTPDKDGYPNQATATFGVENDYQLVRPEIPQKMKGRIDDAMWSEFTNLVFQAARQVDSEQYKSAYNRFTYFFIGSILSVFIGSICLIVGISTEADSGGSAFAIILGVLLSFAGAYGTYHFHTKKEEMHENFYLYVIESIDDFLVNLNVKYKNKIYFEKTVYDKSHDEGFIEITFELNVEKVTYIPNKKKKAKSKAKSKVIENNNNINIVNNIAQQPLLSQQSQQEVVMVQMPDGKMVAAQIIGPVSNIQMNKDQNPSAPALYHSQKSQPAYNPNGKKDSEEGEGVGTNAEDVYI